jgi:hypothetical protein
MMFMIASRTQIKMQNLDSLVKLQLRLEKTSFKQDINKHSKVFGKKIIYKKKILMIFHRQMHLLQMVMRLRNNTKDSKLLIIMILMISLRLNTGKTTIYTITKISLNAVI